MPDRDSGVQIPNRLINPDKLLRVLKETQNNFGCLPDNQLGAISDSLGIPLSEVYGVATFYSFLSIRKQGRHVIKICKSLPCFLKKSQQLVSAIEDVTGCKLNNTSADARFSIQLTNCIGECDKAPAMMIDGRIYVDLTANKIPQILKDYE